MIRTQTEQFLELFSRTLNAVVLTEWTSLNKLFLLFDARALLLHSNVKLSRMFPCILLIRNHIIFLVQFGINKHLLIFSKITNCTRPTGCAILSVFGKIDSCLFIPNCTRNHVITTTNDIGGGARKVISDQWISWVPSFYVIHS